MSASKSAEKHVKLKMNAVRLTRNGHTSIFSPILEVKPSA